jgi:hypothetical protein
VGAFDGDNCARASLVWSPDGTRLAYRAMLHGAPARSAVIVQGVDDEFTDVLLLDGATFDIGRLVLPGVAACSLTGSSTPERLRLAPVGSGPCWIWTTSSAG